jgi:glyoxylase-like metal-dependent hydrolase (beta-lactamase superfamily II)
MTSSAQSNAPADPPAGRPEAVAPGIRRLLAPNPGPYTFRGTNTYILGEGRVAIVDPGPDDPAHLAALLEAVAGETVTHILVTHTHRDHSAGVPALVAATGAVTAGGGPHRPARPLAPGAAATDAGGDTAFVPDLVLADGDVVTGDGWRVEAVATPGHTANHLVFAVPERDLAFSGDHVMGWATTVVAPPDGSMTDYMASLDKLLTRRERLYLPGHGDPVVDAPQRLRALKAHRLMREAAILDRLAKGDTAIPEMVAAIYRDLDPRLRGAAALSVLAHLEDLAARGKVVAEDGATLSGRFRPA